MINNNTLIKTFLYNYANFKVTNPSKEYKSLLTLKNNSVKKCKTVLKLPKKLSGLKNCVWKYIIKATNPKKSKKP